MKDLVEQLDKLRKLEDNWDSYGGKKPTTGSIRGAVRFVEAMTITASPDGYACLVVCACGIELELEFDNDGRAWPLLAVEAKA